MLTLQKRLHLSFVVALALVLITGATSIYYLQKFDEQVHETLITDIELAESSEALRNSMRGLRSAYQAYMAQADSVSAHDNMLKQFDVFMADLQQSRSISVIKDNISIHEEIIKEANDLRAKMDDLIEQPDERAAFGTAAGEFFSKVKEQLDTVQKHRREEMVTHRSNIDRLFSRARQNQILIIIVMLIGGAFLAFFMPRRTVWPFRRILWALHEAWECNLSVRLPVQGADELADLSREFNQMMAQLEELDGMKVKRIAFERRRFEVLANSLNMGVILVTVEGKILFVNAPAFRVFNVTSSQVINKELESAPFPKPIIEMLLKGLSTKKRVEDHQWEGTFKTTSGKEVTRTVSIDLMPVRTHAGDLVNLLMFIEERGTPREDRLFQREVRTTKESL